MRKIAFVFPGQGAQQPGMGMELYNDFESAKEVFDTAGEYIKKLTFESPQEELNLTINAQPCLFVADLAALEALKSKGIYPDGLAGFSLGELPGLVQSGLLNLEQGLDYVNFRARAMHQCALLHSGGMFAVIGLSEEAVIEICNKIEGAHPANFNCPNQVVVACSASGAEELKAHVSSNCGKVIKLAASGAFHSPLMDKARSEIEQYLEEMEFGDMEVPLYSNVTGEVYENPKELSAKQVNSPVLWQKTIENMIRDGYDTFIEVGPGKTLTGLIKKINKQVETYNVYNAQTLEETANRVGGMSA